MFGMGTGISSSPWSPENRFGFDRYESQRFGRDLRHKKYCIRREHRRFRRRPPERIIAPEASLGK